MHTYTVVDMLPNEDDGTKKKKKKGFCLHVGRKKQTKRCCFF